MVGWKLVLVNNSFDKSKFFAKPYEPRRVNKPWGHELLFVPDDHPYMVKLECINAGKRLSLQIHRPGRTSAGKVETWVLYKGQAKLIWENSDGELVETEMESGKSYSTAVGQKHRLMGITDCEVFEASIPEGDGTTERLEDDYNRPDETVEMRSDPHRGWNQ